MGEAKRKQYSRAEFLGQHPVCCYCGDLATTTDHCPPRSFFLDRWWPEGFEFPCCEPCNVSAREQEQICSVIFGIAFKSETPAPVLKPTIESLRQSHPEVVKEWLGLSRNEMRRAFRSRFGDTGDQFRAAGYEAVGLGPLSQAAMNAFAAKLGQALYYKYVGRRLVGNVWMQLLDGLTPDTAFDDLLADLPRRETFTRNGRNLWEQFAFRYAVSDDPGMLLALVRLRDQFMLLITVLSSEVTPHPETDLGPAIAFIR